MIHPAFRRLSAMLAGLSFLYGASISQAVNNATAAAANDILQNRCMVCHGCYDAPCQLKLEAHEGLVRGATKTRVYNGARFRAENLTRLFDDGLNEKQWRDKGFYSVLDKENPELGVMHRLLELKQEHPLPTRGALPEGFDFSLSRDQQCPKQEEFGHYKDQYPLWGMPYGLPGLNPDQHKTMVDWIAQGAPALDQPPLNTSTRGAIKRWEQFLNGETNQQKLMARYLFEHLFLADLHFENDDNPAWFRMVRSYTRPGHNIGLIATRRPYDDPGTSEFYYRLQRMPTTPLRKKHMPYLLDDKRMKFYKGLFISDQYQVRKLPGYKSKIASNPFKSFQQIPVDSRYRFLLSEAQFSIMNFIKGSVCRGQIALNVIEDHFWVMFIDPDNIDAKLNSTFLANESDNLRLPSASTNRLIDLLAWKTYARSEQRFKDAKMAYINRELNRGERKLDTGTIWDGDGNNANAALTVFRHFDTASVVKGFVGDIPKTAWVIDYSLLERIHYLLVAGFDVYGSTSHQLESRMYMDFLRRDGEFNFLMYLPPEHRKSLQAYWYRDARNSTTQDFFGDSGVLEQAAGIDFVTDDPKREFLLTMRNRIYGAKAARYDYRQDASQKMIDAFSQLEGNIGPHNHFLPQVSFVNVIGSKRDEAYTILRNNGYSNIAQLFQEKERTLPAEDNLTIVKGFIGAYPNYFFQVSESQIGLFASDIATLKTQEDYKTFLNRYGVHRNALWFWSLSDKFHVMQKEQDPIGSGLFDFNRYHSH